MPITRYENFLDESLYQECIRTARHLLTLANNVFATNLHWDKSIIGDSMPVLIHGINEKSALHAKLKNQIEEKIKLKLKPDNAIMFYYWTRYSFIPWHNDGCYDAGLTVYLNERWDLNNGGLFLYKDEDNEIRAIVPKRNSATLQQGGVEHATTAMTFGGDYRITLQVFFGGEENAEDIERKNAHDF